MSSEVRARLFISCGQQRDSVEENIADQIRHELEIMGFEPYVAAAEQTLKGVKENILKRLGESEYVVFVDFKRDKLFIEDQGKLVDTGKHRGSLFSNQELAIATYLDIDCIAFQEQGVRELDGILRFIQANCTTFTDRNSLPKLIADKVNEKIKKGGWSQHWRNELTLERDNAKEHDKVNTGRPGPIPELSRYYHIAVHNHHRDRIAYDCVGYVERIEDVSSNKVAVPDLVELKWKGLTAPRIAIPPQKFRYLDAFNIRGRRQNSVNLGINWFGIDYRGYYDQYTLRRSNDYNLTYVIFSNNFPPARATFRLHGSQRIDNIEFTKCVPHVC